ncbi:MAG TPA: hypothetical protein VGE63_02960 [Candidatus Paceibacterota bacterium]
MDKKTARKFLYITLGIAAIIILIAVFLVLKKRNVKILGGLTTPDVISAEEDKKLDEQIQKALDSIDFETLDTDGDGVPDWQENIYGLDPNSKSSFGEGTSDKIFVDNIIDYSAPDIGIKPDKTEEFAMSTFKISKDPSLSGDPQTGAEALVDSIKATQVSKVYTTADIRYLSNYRESFYKYINLTMPFLQSTFVSQEDFKSINSESVEAVAAQKLSYVRDNLFSLEKILVGSTPPEMWVSQHLALLNAVVDVRTKLNYLLRESNDPILSITSLATINEAFTKYYGAYSSLLTAMKTWGESQ